MSAQRRRPVIWSDLIPKRFPAVITQSVDRCQRKWNGGSKTYREYIQNLTNSLVGLPVEVIVLIACSLSTASRVLLSLSSKRLRAILTECFDLTFASPDEKLEFLLSLERDLPDFLTCRSCAWMFRWRLCEPMNYTCPRSDMSAYSEYHIFPQRFCYQHHVAMSREVVDLVLRARRCGHNYGLPESCIDHECHDDYRASNSHIHQRYEGRIVNDEFFVAKWCSLASQIDDTEWRPYFKLSFMTCPHVFWTFRDRAVEGLQSWNREQTLDLGTIKCSTCATDLRIKLHSEPGIGLKRMEVNSWQNYGQAWPYKREDRLLLSTGNAKLIEGDTSLRDLQRDFIESARTFN